jgi:hypothetical protein
VSDQLNKVKYAQFIKQARGNDITDIQVSRVDRKDKVVLQYVGTAKKSRQRFVGEWAVARTDRTEDDVKADIRKFLDHARKEFFVRRGQGLEGDDYKDAAQDVDAVKPLTSSSDQKSD